MSEQVEQRSLEDNSKLNESGVSHYSRASYRRKHVHPGVQGDLIGEEVKQSQKSGHKANKPSIGISSADSELPEAAMQERERRLLQVMGVD